MFDSTVVLLDYDENDGFFDHVPPPSPASGTAGEFVDGTAIGLGFRVPMLVISPWSRGGWMSSEVLDHTSVIRFLETWTAALGTPAVCANLSAWRRAVCGDLTGAFDFTAPVYGLPALPSTSTVIGRSTCDPLPNPSPVTNALPAQEGGTKPARALPYQPNGYVDRLEFDAVGKTLLWIDVQNEGPQATRSAHFAVYANQYRGGGPWHYTVAAGATVSDYFNTVAYTGGWYDFTITTSADAVWSRRFTGHLETGGPSVTG